MLAWLQRQAIEGKSIGWVGNHQDSQWRSHHQHVVMLTQVRTRVSALRRHRACVQSRRQRWPAAARRCPSRPSPTAPAAWPTLWRCSRRAPGRAPCQGCARMLCNMLLHDGCAGRACQYRPDWGHSAAVHSRLTRSLVASAASHLPHCQLEAAPSGMSQGLMASFECPALRACAVCCDVTVGCGGSAADVRIAAGCDGAQGVGGSIPAAGPRAVQPERGAAARAGLAPCM